MKVSIVVPIYNVEKYIRQCLDSLINQTLRDIEIILIDDGSPDSCGQIIDSYAKNDSRIIVVHKENGGYGSAVNEGFNRASGEYIGIVEPDDYVELDMYEKLYNKAKLLDADVCKAGFFSYNSFDKEKPNIPWARRTSNEQNIFDYPDYKTFSIREHPRLLTFHASIWSAIYKNSFLKSNNIFINSTSGASYQDFPFFVEVMCKAKKITAVHEYLYHWRVEANQQSSTNSVSEKNLIMADQSESVLSILKMLGMFDELKEYIIYHIFLANYGFFCRMELDLKEKYFIKLKRVFSIIKDDKSFQFAYFNWYTQSLVKSIINDTFEVFLIKLSLDFKYPEISEDIVLLKLRKYVLVNRLTFNLIKKFVVRKDHYYKLSIFYKNAHF